MTCELGLGRDAINELRGWINMANAKYLNSLPTRGNKKNIIIGKAKSIYEQARNYPLI